MRSTAANCVSSSSVTSCCPSTWTTCGANQWHTDAVYRAMISAFPGVRPDGVYFQHGAPRGPDSANAFVLFDADVPAATYLAQINAHIREQGNHGHGDDLLVMVMPETQHTLHVML